MMYTNGNKRHDLDTFDSVTTILYYTAANVANGYVEIELDIDPLYFKDNFNAHDPGDISFTPFSEYTPIQRHAKALKNAMADTTDRRAEEAWTFHQAAEAAKTQAQYVTTSKLVFQHAADVAKLHKAVLI